MAVLVLQAFAVERGAPRGAAEQETARPRVTRRPRQVADPLEPEHRVVDVERDHRAVRHRVRGGRRDPGRHGPRLVDALLQHLAVLVLLVVHELVGVLGLVQLPDLRPDPELAEHALHAEGARLVGHDRHHPLADLLVPQQGGEDPDERHRGGDRAIAGRLSCASNAESSGTGSVCDERSRRTGIGPPSASRRSRRYASSAPSSANLRNGTSGMSSSGRSTRPNRSRNARNTFSPIFFCWWVMFWPSPASPIP